jgi:hypothetical protein
VVVEVLEYSGPTKAAKYLPNANDIGHSHLAFRLEQDSDLEALVEGAKAYDYHLVAKIQDVRAPCPW